MFFVALPRGTDQFVNVTRSFEYNLLHSETLRQSLQIDFGDFTEVRLTCDNRRKLRELCCLVRIAGEADLERNLRHRRGKSDRFRRRERRVRAANHQH